MKITIWSLKGGVGKTSIALNLALSCNCKIITNERYSLLSEMLNDKKFLQLDTNQKIPQFEKKDNIIFDMGGTVDKRIIDCLKQSDFVLVPTTANDIDIQGCISTLRELEGYIDEKKIIVIVNKIEKKSNLSYVKGLIDLMDEYKHKYKFFEINRSKGLVNIFDKKKSIKALFEEGGLNKRYYKIVNEQFNELIKVIED